MHVGGKEVEYAVFIQNQMDLGRHNAEVYMRFDTDLNSTKEGIRRSVPDNSHSQLFDSYGRMRPTEPAKTEKVLLPTMYTDQNGFTVEKRVKIDAIGYEGNTYPVNTMAYLQDEQKNIRFTVLVDRTHGFSSMENGRIEGLVERRTVFDDGRGMGEGVTDNKDTVSNYVLLLEKVNFSGPHHQNTKKSYEPLLPTLAAHRGTQELSYPPATFVFHDENSSTTGNLKGVYPFFNQEFPCDSHVLNLRSMSESNTAEEFDMNFPSSKALLIVQKLGYLCVGGKLACGNLSPNRLFYPTTTFNGLKVESVKQSSLSGLISSNSSSLSSLAELEAKPFEIKSAVVSFQ